jgi:DNA polymerase III epsilon subunit-like protein
MFFDTETTGLIDNSLIPAERQPQVIEFFGCVRGKDDAPLEELEFFADPGKPLSEEITRITGIKTEDVRGQPPFSARASEVIAMIEGADAVVAHNLSYDMTIVDFELRKLGLSVKWPRRKICTVEATEHLKGHRLSLSALHELLFGEPFSGAHRARFDVLAVVRCYNELFARGEI